jgi:hypothetical protein
MPSGELMLVKWYRSRGTHPITASLWRLMKCSATKQSYNFHFLPFTKAELLCVLYPNCKEPNIELRERTDYFLSLSLSLGYRRNWGCECPEQAICNFWNSSTKWLCVFIKRTPNSALNKERRQLNNIHGEYISIPPFHLSLEFWNDRTADDLPLPYTPRFHPYRISWCSQRKKIIFSYLLLLLLSSIS